MDTANVQYVSNEQGSLTNVLIPIELWKGILSKLEPSDLLKSETLKLRLLESKQREEGSLLSQVVSQPGADLVKKTSLSRKLHWKTTSHSLPPTTFA